MVPPENHGWGAGGMTKGVAKWKNIEKIAQWYHQKIMGGWAKGVAKVLRK